MVEEVPENEYLSKGYGGPIKVTKLTSFMAVPTELLQHALKSTLVGAPDEEEQERLRQEAAQERLDAHNDWTALRQRLADNAPALAVLDLHKPVGDHWPKCDFPESDEYYTEWPCDTYTAIRDAAK